MFEINDLKLVANRFYTVRYPYYKNYKHRELLDKIKKFSFILSTNHPRRRGYYNKYAIESVNIFVHNLHKLFLFCLDNNMNEVDMSLIKERYITPKCFYKLTEKKSLKRKDEQMYNLIHHFCYDTNFYATVGSYCFRTED